MLPPTAALDIARLREPDDALRFAVSGEVDARTAPHLISGLRDASAAAGRLRIELSGVTFIDCRGLSALLSVLGEERAAGRIVEVDYSVSPAVRRILQLTRTASQIWPPPGA
jgi:anti-anti-sigma factor